MALYFVSPLKNSDALLKKAKDITSDSAVYALNNGSFFVVFDGTNKDLKEKIGIADASVGTGVIISASNYSGYAPKDLWEWLNIKAKDI